MFLRSMTTTPRSPRDQTPLTTSEGTDALATILAELRQQRVGFEERLERMEQRITELSAIENNIPHERIQTIAAENAGLGVVVHDRGDASVQSMFKFKTDTFDGSVPLKEFLVQFAVIARANAWDDAAKAVALASCLRGKARSVLDSLEDTEIFSYAELKAKLELRFGEAVSAQTYYLQFTNRRQKFGEEFTTLGADLERLSRLAYSECSAEVRDKIACSQFVAALSDGYVKRTLQLEGIVTLAEAVERAKAIKIINENSFSGRRNGNSDVENKGMKTEGKRNKRSDNNFKDNAVNIKEKECWQCGEKGHFRSECPVLVKEN